MMYSIYAKVGDTTVCLHDDTVSNPKVKVIDPVLTLEDSSAGSLTFKLAPNNVGYGEYTITEYVSSGEDTSSYNYVLTTSCPPDWITDFASYYTESGGVYTPVAPSAPEFEPGVYYYHTFDAQQHDVYVVLNTDPGNWSSTYTNYYYKSGDDYLPVPAGPKWVANTYYYRESQDGVIAMTRTVDLVERMASTITVYRTNQNGSKTEIWEGRVLSESNDFNNLREIYCEGALAYLNDTIQPQRDFAMVTVRQFMEAILNTHNGKVSDDKKFYIGQVVITNNSVENRRTDYGSTWDAISSFVEDFQCHIEIRKGGDGKRYLDVFSDYPRINSQIIRLGSNLLDFTRSWNMANLATAVLPTGAVLESATSSSVGEPLEPTTTKTSTILYLDEDDNNTVKTRSTNVAAYVVKTYTLQPETNYYVSSRLHKGYVAYAMYTSGGSLLIDYVKTSGRDDEDGFEDRVDEKITTPPSEAGNPYTLKVCSWGNDITAKVKAEIPPTEDFDKYLTVVDANDVTGYTLLVSMPSDWYTNYKSYYTALYIPVPSQSGHAPAFGAGSYYEYSDIYGYVNLITEPDDWDENYQSYFIKTSGYASVTGNLPPTWRENTYYRKSVWHTKGSPYVVNQDAVTRYGWIEKHLEFTDVDDATSLCDAAKNWLESGQFDEMTIEISAIDLGSIGVDYESIRLLDKVKVVSDPHGMNRLFPVTKLEIPLDKPQDQQFTLGYSSEGESISAASTEAMSTINNKIAGIPSMSSILDSAQQNAAQIINNSQAGYITFLKDANGHPYEMVISQTLDYTQSPHVWRFNSGGLGYSDSGYSPNAFKLALTMDGAIVADFITSGTMAAERIFGGTLTVGALGNNKFGIIRVLDGNGDEICRFDESGGNINGQIRNTNGAGYSELRDGRIICGEVGSSDIEHGRIDGDIEVSLDGQRYYGVSIEAKRSGTGTSARVDGVISLCAKRIVVANSNPLDVTGTVADSTVPVVTSVRIANGDKYVEAPSSESAPSDWPTGYYTKSGDTYTAVPSSATYNPSATYYKKTTVKQLVTSGKEFHFINGMLVTIGQETVISRDDFPESESS